MSKSPAERLAKAERKARKQQRRVAEARRAANLGAQPPGAPAAALPAPDPYDDHLLGKAAGGDEVARELLRRRGTDGIYASYAWHVLTTATDPAMRAHAAGVLGALDESFDEYAPLPRGAGSAW
jgi:hypothetical protein